jgi:hypothetical protein
MPELCVPLATHTGHLRHPDIGGEHQLLVFAGPTLPFRRTRAQREAAGDPRPSIEERHGAAVARRALGGHGGLFEAPISINPARDSRGRLSEGGRGESGRPVEVA